jgi:hypothetical protein
MVNPVDSGSFASLLLTTASSVDWRSGSEKRRDTYLSPNEYFSDRIQLVVSSFLVLIEEAVSK